MSKVAQSRNTMLSYAVGTTLLFGASATNVTAQESAVLEEVVVTAQKREESVQDVGIAITAFSGEQLDTFGFTSSTDIATMTPGVFLSGNNGGNTLQFTVRGVANPEFADLLETPNAVYVDEGYVATGQGQMFANFDMERVEILKGPQGTLFGRNATGGLIHYITRRPTQEFEAYGDLSYGSYDSVRFEGAVSGPLTEGISGRVSGFYNKHDGIWDNIFPDQLPAGVSGSEAGADSEIWLQDEFAVRGQLLFEWRDDMELLVKGQYAEQNPGSGPYQNIATVPIVTDTNGDGFPENVINTKFADDLRTTCERVDANTGACRNSPFDLDFDGTRPSPTGDFFGYDDIDGEGDTTSTDHYQEDYDKVELYGVTANYKWEMTDALTLTSITNFAKQEKRQSLDVDSGPAPHFIVANDSEHTWWTQEIRFNGNTDRAKWVAGFYYLNIDAQYNAGLSDTRGGFNLFGSFPPPFGAGPAPFGDPTLPPADAGLISDLQTDSYSLFGQIDYDITSSLTGIIGLRIIQEEKEFNYTNRLYPNLDDRTVDVNQAPLFIQPGVFRGNPVGNTFEYFPPHQEDTSDTLWSGKIGLNWTPTDDLLVYGTINRGVKAGSFNAPLLTFLTPDEYGYDEEVLIAYEVGFKSTIFDGKARVNGSFYYYDYSDYQIFKFVGTSGAVFNADAEYYGMELDFAAQPFQNFDILFGFSWIDATVEDVEVATSLFRDVEPTFTPEYQASGLARYTWPALIGAGDVAVQMDFNYASEAFFNINNFDTHEMDSYVVGNARVSWYHPNEKVELQFFVNNLADERYQNLGFELADICGCDERSYGRPRWFGGRIRYSF